ncbi:glycosyltransferase family 4 protein [candidate division TA06 bacterium]|nr:glycosyltransferase family 4 protein [candidate division TA06 bacterium]
MKKVILATSSPLGQEAIGKVAQHLAEGLAQAGLLLRFFHIDGQPLKNSIKNSRAIAPVRIPVLGRFDWGRKLLLSRQEAFYQKKVAQEICRGESGLYYGWVLQSQKSLEACRSQGIKSVLECGMIYPPAFRDLLAAEFQRYNIPLPWHLGPKRVTDSLYELGLADIIAAPSQLVVDSFIASGFEPDKFLIMPPGVDCDYFHPSAVQGTKEPWALYIGRLELAKGVHHLITAWQRVKKPGRRLVLIGNLQPCLKNWLDANQQMLDASVELAGVKTDLRPYFEKARFTVLPSLADGFGMAVMEGMAAGLPAIVTENCGVKSAIDDGKSGWIVPVADTGLLAQKMGVLFSDAELCLHLGKNARTRALDYSWHNFKDKAVELILPYLRKK